MAMCDNDDDVEGGTECEQVQSTSASLCGPALRYVTKIPDVPFS